MGKLDAKKMVSEIASQHGILLDEKDPAFTIVRLNQIALEQSAQILAERIAVSLRDFELAVEQVQITAGKYVAQEFKQHAAALREELQGDIQTAGSKAREIVDEVYAAHKQVRPALIRWMVVGLISGLGLFGAGFWTGLQYPRPPAEAGKSLSPPLVKGSAPGKGPKRIPSPK